LNVDHHHTVSKGSFNTKASTGIGLANIITFSRLLIVPVLIYTILKEYTVISAVLVVLAVLSDWLDGIIARKYNAVTKHGELLDPAVDKIFTISVLVAFVEMKYISTYLVFLIVTREMLVTWMRSVLVNKNIVVPASYLGKVKTTIQLIAILLLSLKFIFLGNLVLWVSIAVAYISAYDYLKIFIKEKGWNL